MFVSFALKRSGMALDSIGIARKRDWPKQGELHQTAMMFPVVYIILVLVGGGLICTVCTVVTAYKTFRSGRNEKVKVLDGLKYIPEVIIEEEVIVEHKKKLSKRQLRRKRMREVARELKLTEAERLAMEKQDDEEFGFEDDDSVEELNSPSKKLLSWVVSAFSSKNGKVQQSPADVEVGEGQIGPSTKSGASLGSEDDIPEGSSKSKRFISQDRLQRKEARMLLVRPKEVIAENTEEEEDEVMFDNTVSLLSLAMAKARRIAEIMDARKLRKSPGKGKVVVDIVALNAGPSQDLVPEGYEFVSQELGPALITPEVLLYKRILYLWDGTVGNIVGWHIGTIVGTSENPGFNYRIKYDRAETKSIFVDGIQPVFLSLSGENAFGRRWVVIQKIGGRNSS
jgi:hypothetical protein